MFKRIVTGALIFGMAALAPPALAQMACAPRVAVAEQLTRSYGEALLVQGFAPSGIVEFWASVEQRSWTLLLTRPDGLSCVLGIGEEWAPAPRIAAPANADAPLDDGF